MQMTFPTPTTATIGHTASRMQRGHILSARSPSLPDRLHQRRGNFEQAGSRLLPITPRRQKSVGGTLPFGANFFAPARH